MKKHCFLSLLVGGFIFASCSSDKDMLIEEQQSTVKKNGLVVQDGVVYPHKSISRVIYDDLDWESATKVVLPNGKSVDYPWVSAPYLTANMKEKLKSEEGWELIAHTMHPEEQEDRSFLIFHNYITGTLRVFCYISTFATNNTGFWKVSFNIPNKLLNFSNTYAIPHDTSDGRTEIIVSNQTISEVKNGFAIGWNGFDIELAYDPDAIGKMTIVAYNTNKTTIDLDGRYEGKTDGAIVTQTKSPTTISKGLEGVGKLAGNAVGKWVKKETLNIKIPILGSDDIVSLAKKGVTSVFNSFAGLFKKNTTQTSDVHLVTHGTMNLDGFAVISTPAPTDGVDINLSLIDGKLGGWNLDSHPTVYWKSAGIYEPRLDNADANYSDFYYRTKGVERTAYNVLLNPKLLSKLSSKTVTHDMVFCRGIGNPTYTLSDFGNLGNDNGVSLVYGTVNTLYQNDSITVSKYESDIYLKTNVFGTTGKPLPYSDLSTDPKAVKIGGLKNIRMKIYPHLTLVINGIEYTYYGTKTYLCRHEWGKFDFGDVYD